MADKELPPLPKGKFFYIIGRESGLVLEIQDANLEPGAPVVLGPKRDIRDQPVESLCQMWYNCYVSGTIRCRANANLAFTLNDDDQLVVDVVAEDEGRYQPTERQHWEFVQRKGIIKAQSIDGEPRFAEVADHEVDPGSAVIANEETGEDNQLFDAEHLVSAYFLIVSEMSDLCLEVSCGMLGGVKENQEIVTSKKDGKEQQLWFEDEYGVLRCKAGGMAMQVEREPGSEIKTAEWSKPRDTQHWHLMPNGYICNRERPDIVFDIAGRKSKDGAKVIIWEWKGMDNQQWRRDLDIPVKKKKAKKSKKSKKSKKESEDEEESEEEEEVDSDIEENKLTVQLAKLEQQQQHGF